MRRAGRAAAVRVPQPEGSEPALSEPRAEGLIELDALDALFAALDHPVRRHVLQVLYARGGWMTAGDLARRFSHSWPTTTRHLRVLEDAGLVIVETVGRERHLSLEHKRLRVLLDLWCSGVGLGVDDRPAAANGTEA